MKKFTILFLVATLLAGTVFAQPILDEQVAQAQERDGRQRTPQQTPRQQRGTETVTISGEVKLERGIVTLESGGRVYFVPRLSRYIGFIDGLTEGAAISVKGNTFNNMLHPQELTINGKVYEMTQRAMAQGYGRFNQQPHYPNAPRQQFNAPNRGNRQYRNNPPSRSNNAPRRRDRSWQHSPDCDCCF